MISLQCQSNSFVSLLFILLTEIFDSVLDLINVMTYDFHAIFAGFTSENSPLYGGVNESDWQQENRNCDAAIRYWLDGGADPQKVAMGVAFYGHSFILQNPSNHGLNDPTQAPSDPGPYTDNLGSLGYNEVESECVKG
jgi:chitinase